MSRVLCDSDCILADFMAGVALGYYLETGEVYDLKKVTAFDGLAAGAKNFPDLPNELYHRPGFFRDLTPLEGAVEAIQDIQRAGHEIVICTAPCNDHCIAEKLEWFRRWFPFIPAKNVFVGSKKHFIKADALIDDALHNVIPTEMRIQTRASSRLLTRITGTLSVAAHSTITAGRITTAPMPGLISLRE